MSAPSKAAEMSRLNAGPPVTWAVRPVGSGCAGLPATMARTLSTVVVLAASSRSPETGTITNAARPSRDRAGSVTGPPLVSGVSSVPAAAMVSLSPVVSCPSPRS